MSSMLLQEQKNEVVAKWEEALDKDIAGHGVVLGESKRYTTAQLLENQYGASSQNSMIAESQNLNGVGGVENWNPILMSMVRRIAPKLIAYDVCGVQPMTGPTGLIFALKARAVTDPSKRPNDPTQPETMGLDEVNAGFSGNGVANSGATFGGTMVRGGGVATAVGEIAPWKAVGVSIERKSVEATTRQLRADYSQELAEDMKRIHNLSAEAELINILTNEITAELNREVLGVIYGAAKQGAQFAGTAGTFDLNTDSDGRWSVEKYKGLITAIEFDANRIAIETRRGKGNKLFVSANVGTVLQMAGMLDFTPLVSGSTNLTVDPSGATYSGKLLGKYDVYVDPYATDEGYCVGYKGVDQYDAGIFYCPYIPLQMSRAVDSDNFTNAIGFKTRYGITANPFTTLTARTNTYYRSAVVANIL